MVNYKTIFILLLVTAYSFSSKKVVYSHNKPNIIFILTDDQGYGELSCHGNPIIKTPEIDKLYSESIRMTNFHVAPTCAPTRAQLMTGKHEFRNGVTHTILLRERLDLKVKKTLPQVLKDVGYKTAIFGKWHLGDAPEYRPDHRGFDEALVHGTGGLGQVRFGDHPDNKITPYNDPTLYHNGKFEVKKGYCTDIYFDEAIRWMEQNSDQPTFTYIATNTPHSPTIVDERYSNPYKEMGEKYSKYYGMIANIDENVGKLLKWLKETNREKNTIVIFMTDNGHAISGPKNVGHDSKTGFLLEGGLYNAGMRGGKGQPWEGGTRVPCFIRWPEKFKAGIDINHLTGGIDILPTLADIVGAKIPEGVDGKSFYSLLVNQKAEFSDRFIVAHVGRWPQGMAKDYKFKSTAIRSQNFRMVWNFEGQVELHDMVNDPGEKINIIDQYPELVKSMNNFYDKWWGETLPLLINESLVPDRKMK